MCVAYMLCLMYVVLCIYLCISMYVILFVYVSICVYLCMCVCIVRTEDEGGEGEDASVPQLGHRGFGVLGEDVDGTVH